MIRIFTLTLRALPGSSSAYRRLARTLKTALRRDQLRCVDICEQTNTSRRRPAPTTGVKDGRRQEETKMDMKKYNGAFFLKIADIKDAGPSHPVIIGVTEGKYGRPDLEFDDGSKLSLNATNNRTLFKAYGENSADWLEKEVELYVGQIEFEGKLQDSILIRPISPPKEKKKTAPSKETAPPKPNGGKDGDVLGDEIPF
jgi:hypothetical protein